MSMVYGLTKPPGVRLHRYPVLPKEKKEAKERNSSTSFWRIAIAIAEIGATFLPGVGPLATTAIGLAGAVGNTILSAKEGTLSAIGVAFDFGSALIPGISGLRNAARTRRMLQSEEMALKETAALERVGIKTNRKLSAINNKRDRAIGRWKRKRGRTLRQLKDRELQNFREWNRVKKQSDSMRWRLQKNVNRLEKYRKNPKILKEIKKLEWTITEEWNPKFYKWMKPKELNKTGEHIWGHYRDLGDTYKLSRAVREKFALDTEIGIQGITKKYRFQTRRAWQEYEKEIVMKEKIFRIVRETPFLHMTDSKRILKYVSKKLTQKEFKIMKDFYEPLILNPKVGTAKILFEARGVAMEKMKTTSDMLKGTEAGEIWAAFMRKAKTFGHQWTEQNMEFELNKTLAVMSELEADKIPEIKALFNHQIEQSFKLFSKNAESKRRRLIKFLGTKKFNDNWVQRAQLIDPNDVGRAPVEFVYRKLKRKIDRLFEKKAFKYAMRKAKKIIKTSKDLEEAFLKAGGILIPSRYLLGIKILGGPPGNKMVLVKFRKDTTSTKKGHNRGGKKDVLVTMTTEDIRRLEEEGSSYWFAVGKKKGWFVSRGGKSVSRNFATLSNNLSLFLGFVPIPALRNVLSITSNWVENISSIVNGTYTDNWLSKFKRAFFRSAINRTGRLLTKVVAGNFAAKVARGGLTQATYVAEKRGIAIEQALSKGFIKGSYEYEKMVQAAISKASAKGKWIGRELQRLSTTTLSTIEGKDKDGNFKFIGTTKSGTFGERWRKKFLSTAMPTSLRGELIRHGTRKGNTYGRRIIGNRRYMGQIGRIYSAVTVSGTVKPLRSLTKIK